MVIVVLILLGLCFGSFTNALVWRVHEQSKKANKGNQKLSITRGRSMCPDCKHELAATDLLPVVSWLALRGKCRYCQKPISWQYPLVEALMAGLFVFSYIYWPYGFNSLGWARFGLWLVFLIGFVALLVYDIRWMKLPNRIVYPLLGMAVLQVLLIALVNKDIYAFSAAFWGVLCLGGLFWALFQISGGKWIGGGDVKLGAVIGLSVGGSINALLLLFIASLLGSLFALPGVILHKKNLTSRVPFGPFLIIATIVTYLFGASIIAWYKRQFLLL